VPKNIILVGKIDNSWTKDNIDCSYVKKIFVDIRVDNISQIIFKATKSRKQINYSSKLDFDFGDYTKTPFAVG